MANYTAGGVEVEVEEEDCLQPATTTVKEEVLNDVIQWQDVEVKKEKQSKEIMNEDQEKIFLVEPKTEMLEGRVYIKDPIGIKGE